MNDKMRITYLVKEPFENDVLLSWQGAQGGFGEGRIFRKLSRSTCSQADRALQPISRSGYAIFRYAELVVQLCPKPRYRKR